MVTLQNHLVALVVPSKCAKVSNTNVGSDKKTVSFTFDELYDANEVQFRCDHNKSAYLSPAGSGQCRRTGLRGHRNRPAHQEHFEENEATHEQKHLPDVFTYHPQARIRIIDLQRSHDSISDVVFLRDAVET